MQLLDLPTELLCLLLEHLYNIEDYTNASSTCRRLRSAFATASPNTILRLAAASAPTFFAPHPHFLVLATARQVADWAVGNEERTRRLMTAFQWGVEGLLDLCVEHAGLTLDDLRRLHLARFCVINPLADKIDKMAGSQWLEAADFWDGGVSEPATIDTDANRATYQILIYSELFASSMKANLEPARNLPKFGLWERLEYIKYCVPDWICAKGHSGMTTLRTGPYHPSLRQLRWPPGDQIAMEHILSCGRWNRLCSKALLEIGPDFQDDWRQELWWNAPLTMGLEGFELVTIFADLELSPEWKDRLTEIRAQIEALQSEIDAPEKIELERPMVGIYDVPTFRKEVRITMAKYWGSA